MRLFRELLESDLMLDSYVSSARHIDVSYFAAGILANLLDCGPWTFEPTSDHCNQSLVSFFSIKKQVIGYSNLLFIYSLFQACLFFLHIV